MKFKIDDQVKVIDQEIYGRVLEVWPDTNEVVIDDPATSSRGYGWIYKSAELICLKG